MLKERSNGLPGLLGRELPCPESKIGVHSRLRKKKRRKKQPPSFPGAVHSISGHMELYENRDREDAKGGSIPAERQGLTRASYDWCPSSARTRDALFSPPIFCFIGHMPIPRPRQYLHYNLGCSMKQTVVRGSGSLGIPNARCIGIGGMLAGERRWYNLNRGKTGNLSLYITP